MIVKAVNSTATARTLRVQLKGATGRPADGRLTVLSSTDLLAENCLDAPCGSRRWTRP